MVQDVTISFLGFFEEDIGKVKNDQKRLVSNLWIRFMSAISPREGD